ncbi:MAG: PAS domain-containing sensor histidine kinase [Bacteroidota bacterium]
MNNNIKIYACLNKDRLCDESFLCLKNTAKPTEFIDEEKLLTHAFIQHVIENKYSLILDFEKFTSIQKDSFFRYLAELPSVLLVLYDQDIDFFDSKELPDNFCLEFFPLQKHRLDLIVEQSFKKNQPSENQLAWKAKYQNLFLNNVYAQLFVDADDNARITEVNKKAEHLYDKDADYLLRSGLRGLHGNSATILINEIMKKKNQEPKTVNLQYFSGKGHSKNLKYIISKTNTNSKTQVHLTVLDVSEKEKENQLYYQQNEMLRSTLESIDDLFFTLNKEGDFTEYYQAADSKHFSLSNDAFIGKNIYDVGFPLDVSKKYLQTIENVIETDQSEHIDYSLEAFGSRLWYSARISPRKNALGITDGVTVLCRDITRQKRTEETLKKARDFYLTLFADFPSMIWKTNTSKKVDFFNKTWLEFTGNDLETELRTDWVEKMHISEVSSFLTALLNAYEKKEPFQIEHRLKHKSGEYQWVINAARPFYNLEGQFAGFIGSCFNIHERKKAEEMLKLQKSAMESALEGILILEDDGMDYPVIYANKELCNITRQTGTNLVGQSFFSTIGCPIHQKTRENIYYSLRNKRSFKGEIKCKRKKTNADLLEESDEIQWRLLYLAPVQNDLTNVNHFVAVLSDITESKKVETALREKNSELLKTNEELDQFVYSTSHELRSPLMSVLGLINLLESENDAREQSVYIDMIRETISRLDKIIHDIIDYSRNSRSDIIYENIDFEDFIHRSIENYKYFEKSKNVKFNVSVKNGVPFLSDKKRMEIIFNNFISNSLKFHNYEQKSPLVDIKVKTSPVNSVITISDNGLGIEEKHLPHLYEMFYRGNEKSTGSGIGLYIVKEIIDKLQGSIQVQSVMGKGTTFTIILPNNVLENKKLYTLNSFSISEM